MPRCGRAIGNRYSALAMATWLPANVLLRKPRSRLNASLSKSATLSAGVSPPQAEGAADRLVAFRGAAAQPQRHDVMRRQCRQVAARIRGHHGRVRERAEPAAHDLRGRAGSDAALGADRVAVGMRGHGLPCAPHRQSVPRDHVVRQRELVHGARRSRTIPRATRARDESGRSRLPAAAARAASPAPACPHRSPARRRTTSRSTCPRRASDATGRRRSTPANRAPRRSASTRRPGRR